VDYQGHEEERTKRNSARNGVPHLDGTARRRRRTSVASQRNEPNRRTSVASQRTDAPPLCHDERRTSIASQTTHLRCDETKTKRRSAPRRKERKQNGVPHLDGTKRNGVPHLDGTNETARSLRTNETAFAPTLQRHEHKHNQHDRNESHEQQRQPLN